jgi:4-hydroxy-3-polyprenylbenzoate decarboxylase
MPDTVSGGADRCTRGACAPPTDPQRDSIFTKGPSDVLDHATSEIASGSKMGFDATKKIPGEGFKRAWPPLIKMDAAVKAKIDSLFGNAGDKPGQKA